MTSKQIEKMRKLITLGKAGKLKPTLKNKRDVNNMIKILEQEDHREYIKGLGIEIPKRKGHVETA